MTVPSSARPKVPGMMHRQTSLSCVPSWMVSPATFVHDIAWGVHREFCVAPVHSFWFCMGNIQTGALHYTQLLEELQRMFCWDQTVSFSMDKQRGTGNVRNDPAQVVGAWEKAGRNGKPTFATQHQFTLLSHLLIVQLLRTHHHTMPALGHPMLMPPYLKNYEEPGARQSQFGPKSFSKSLFFMIFLLLKPKMGKKKHSMIPWPFSTKSAAPAIGEALCEGPGQNAAHNALHRRFDGAEGWDQDQATHRVLGCQKDLGFSDSPTTPKQHLFCLTRLRGCEIREEKYQSKSYHRKMWHPDTK